jgi:nucleotide-binding universal stress UspA family protein
MQAAGDPARLRMFGASYPRAALRDYLEHVARRAEAAVGMSVRPVFREGGWVDEALGKVVEAEAPDLIVMATEARGWWDRLWRDSVTAGVIRRVQTPVLLVPASERSPDLSRELAIDRVLVPLDRSARSESVLGPAASVGSLFDASHDLIHLVRPDPAGLGWSVAYGGTVAVPTAVHRVEASRYLRSVANRLRAQGLLAQWEVVTDDRAPARAIARYADRTGADLIALATRGRGPLARLFQGSTAEKVLRQARVPVLIHRPRT